MPNYPADVILPLNYKSFGLIDSKLDYNSNWDIVWSFTYALSSNTNSQHSLCTFLTTLSSISAFPGQYSGIMGPSYNDGRVALGIIFDSTGYSTLSNTYTVGMSSSYPNSLTIRDKSTIIYHQPLSALDTSFIFTSGGKHYQTLRFGFYNTGRKLQIDYKIDSGYKELLTIPLSTYDWIDDNTILYPGLTYCSPISSNNTNSSILYLKNFHVQGNSSNPTYEYTSFTPLTTLTPTIYTTLTGISAFPI